jgi:protein ImuB
MHEVALGQDRQPMVPGEPARRFVERLEMEWPIEGLEPLSFVLARVCESLSQQLEKADRGAVSITTRLALVSKAGYERTLNLPAPMRDARVLRTLIQLDLEAHPPSSAGAATHPDGAYVSGAGIDVVEVEVEVSPGRVAQGALFVRTLPTPESLATLVARLGALMGEAHVGAPDIVDIGDERVIRQQPFAVRDVAQKPQLHARQTQRACALRRLRQPMPIRMSSLDVVAKAGPWRSSGRWWRRDGTLWDRDAWDLALKDGTLVRVSRNRLTSDWELEGTYD